MRRFHIYIGFIVWLLTSLFAVSCNDELEGNGYTPYSSSNLHVLVPTMLSSRGTNPDDASGLPTYNATVDECQINDLTLYAFPTGNEGKLVAENLPAPTATSMLNENAAEYQLNITPGKYHIYVVANLSDVLSDQTIKTENELKKVVLNYGSVGKPGMPVCRNIPMIYEPKDITVVKATGKSDAEVIANMKFTCVKVKLNLIFDPTQEDVNANFGGKSILIDNIVANKLSPFTNLYWGGKFVEESLADGEYKTGIPSTQYTSGSDAPAVYYTDWEDHTLEAEANNKNDIVGTGKPTPAPIDAAGKWLFQSTYYLPERYISSAADRSYLTINGKVANSASNDYRIDLGHKDENSASEVPTFPRGTYYEITGRIKSLGNMELNCKVSIKPWEMDSISADFNHTTLWVSKTKASVTSTTTDFINYKSNATITPENIGCETKIYGQDLIKPELDILTKQIKLGINKDINYSDYNGVYAGTAKVWIKAGNIKKYIDVDYDVTPYLDVTKKVVIYYNSTVNNTRTIEWDTNLGGIKLEETKLTKGNSTIEMNLNSSDATKATGVFTVKATSDPVTTTIYDFKVKPQNNTTDVKYKTVRVIVRPPIRDYRIYFRAINDRSKYNGGNGSDNFKGILTEGGKNNWSDGWNEDAKDTSDPQPDNHRIYVYTQIGETEDEVTGKGWIFTEGPADKNGWPGEEMVADETNTGWYYKNFTVDAKSVLNTNKSEGKITIKPGETLIMFSNNKDVDQGYSLHRCPHHLEPGIPLFDYEDREGWIVYDPTSDPIWHVYDNMPEIEDIEYKVYTRSELFEWYKVYGIASGTNQFTIWDTAKKSWKCKNVGNGWYKTTITLKAVKGEHEKNILLKRGNNDNSPITLFNGNSFKDDTGYYEGGKWYQGKPKGVTE
ncbi:fimbrial protein [Segatella copri]|uniref:fimbrial protein n=1 Tax=Segatella copri TaxID=165179 RepID=UPI00222E45F3|nr:fimbrial protein [Segatella copri]MCW4073048.1 hypothetical protein [Segatella copri]